MAPSLEAWGNFYVIVGSSAGALTGLQFVVMTLIASTEGVRGRGESISAFGTPNVVHFCSVLLVSSILSIPWTDSHPVGISVALCGLIGTLYSIVVTRRAVTQSFYQPVFEDWLCHNVLPFVAYGTLLVAGLALHWSTAGPLLGIAAAALLLVFVGIHNAWDTVTYIIQISSNVATGPAPSPSPPAAVAPATTPAGATPPVASEAPGGTSASGAPPA